MLVTISKIFALLLAILVMARSITDYRAKKESLSMMLFWILVWVVIVIVAIYPQLVQRALDAMGGNRAGLGTIFGMAISFALFISYRVYVKSHRTEKRLTDLVKNSALEQIKPKKPRRRRTATK